MRRVAASTGAAILGVAVLAVAFGLAGAQRETHLTGTNLIRPFLFTVEIPDGRTACQPQENVPDGTGALRVRAGTFDRPGPAIAVSVERAGRPAVRGERAAGWAQGDIVIRVPEMQGDRLDARECYTNRWPGKLALAGESFGPDRSASIGDEPQPGRARIEYLRPRAEAWWGLGPELSERVGTVRGAFPGGAALYLWALLALAVVGGSLALVLREGSE